MKRNLCEILLPQKKVKKIILIMRLSTILLLFGMLSASASAYSQNKKFSLNLENVSIRSVFHEIEKQSEFSFLYNDAFEDLDKNVSITVKDQKVEDIMNRVFEDTQLSYRILDNNLIVLAPKKSLQELNINGTVVDFATGESLIGVNVQVEGTTIGAVTDVDGKYSISVPDKASVLIFSFIGYVTERIALTGQQTLNIKMAADIENLEEVVVIGYGTQKKRDVSTAIASVGSETLKDRPVSNFAQAISGKMAGVRIAQTNAAPGGGTNIQIRGVGTINLSTSPLFVIDGFPLKDGFNQNENPLNSINPADIESIEVLKDASSSAIYGTQAANGVVIITTKRGKTGKPVISVNVNTGYQKMINKVDVLNKDQFIQYFDDSRKNAYLLEDPNFGTNNPDAPLWNYNDSPETRIQNWTNYSQFAKEMKAGSFHYRWISVTDTIKNSPYNTNWQDEITQSGKVTDVQFSAAGGTENISYMISGGYFDQEGIVKHSGYKRFSFRANLEAKVNRWVRVGLNLVPTLENTDVLSRTDGYSNINPFYNAVAMPPIWSAYDSKNEPVFYGSNVGGVWDWNLGAFVNPYSVFKIQDSRRNARNLTTFFGEIKILPQLTFRSEFHHEFRLGETNYFLPSSLHQQWATSPSRPEGRYQNNTRNHLNNNNILTYQNTFGKHSLTAMLGYSIEETQYRSSYMMKYDYPTDVIPDLNQGTVILNAQNDARTNRSSETMIGSFGRLLYNYAGKYYLTTSVRRDGSSKFGPDKKWGIFPSVSVAWRLSDEKFMSFLNGYVSDWKLRAGWGTLGNSLIPNYHIINTLGTSNYVLGSSSAVSAAYEQDKVANPKLGWETTTDLSFGTDIQILKNRVSLSVDYFNRTTTDMLFKLPLPTITGFSETWANVGSMRNRGYEWSLNTHNLTGRFKWDTNLTLYYYKNEVLDIGSDKRPLFGYVDNNAAYSNTVEGKPVANSWGMLILGPYRDWEDVKTNPIYNAQNPLWRNRSHPGSPKAADVNGDGILDSSDKTVIGSPHPDFTWGMTNSFQFMGFDLAVQVNGVKGGDIVIRNMESVYGRGNGTTNTTVDYFNNYWRPDMPDAKYIAPNRKTYDNSNVEGSLIFKGTYVSIQNIAFGYTLPKALTDKWHFNNTRLYMNVLNAFMFTKYPGFNPEVNSNGNSSLSQGVDNGAYPMSRTVTFGANFSF